MNKFKNYTRVDLATAEEMVKAGHLKQFALYIQLKAKYKHSIVYNYSYYKVARLSGLNPKTVKRYVSKLKKYGLVQETDGNLLFTGADKVKEGLDRKPRRYIETRPWTSYRGILNRIQYLLISNNIRLQEYNAIVHFGQIKGKSNLGRKELKQAIRTHSDNGRLKVLDSEKSDVVLNSSRQIARLLNTSKTTANHILNELKAKKYLKFKERIEKLGKVKYCPLLMQDIKDMNESLQGFFYLHNGFLYKHRGIEIKLVV